MGYSIKDFSDAMMGEAATRFSEREADIQKRAAMIKRGLSREQLETMEPEGRRERFKAREDRFREERGGPREGAAVAGAQGDAPPASPPASGAVGELGLERHLGPTNDLLSIEYLELGVQSARAVGKLEYAGGLEHGTGFFVCPELVLTNHHVIDGRAKAVETTFETYAEGNQIPPIRHGEVLYLDPDRFLLTSKALDFTLVAVEGVDPEHDYGWLPLLAEQGKILIGDAVNIIQHPNGGDKKVVTQNSHLLDLADSSDTASSFCWYDGDTEKGSSGSPVMNNRWEVVALHHKAVPKVNKNQEVLDINGRVMSEERVNSHPELVAWAANEGIRVSRIVQALRAATLADTTQQALLERTLNLWGHRRALRPRQKTGWFGIAA